MPLRTFRKLVVAIASVSSLVLVGVNVGLCEPSSLEAERLDRDLTPMGSERHANADGTIPAWDGGLTKAPADYKPDSFHPDPFSEDDILSTISAENLDQYRDKLSVGQIALLERFPTYRLHIYKSRRTVAWPKFHYAGSKRNAARARLISDGQGLAGVVSGVPFPIPKSGQEIIWNHKLLYRGGGLIRYNIQAILSSYGDYKLVRLREEYLLPLGQEGQEIEKLEGSIYLYFKQIVESPAELAGTVSLVWEKADPRRDPENLSREAWIYDPAQRRVRRAPVVAYDNPSLTADGARSNDMHNMFNGSLELYDWRIVGKREMFVPYNAYKLHSDRVDIKSIVGPSHINPDLARYELHRVWVVEATLREGKRHVHARRTFYVDEDSWQILLVDHYNDEHELSRVSEAHCINYYDALVFWTTLEVHYDLQGHRHIVMGLDNQDRVYNFSPVRSVSDFQVSTLRRAGAR